MTLYVVLLHELTHAYMFSTLSDEGVIHFDENGEPILEVNCVEGIDYNQVKINMDLSPAERFVALICAMNATGTLTNQWSHDLFNSQVFSTETYQQKIKDFIFSHHDWNGEPLIFKNTMQGSYGSQWKSNTAGFLSWRGLEGTQGFQDWYGNAGYSTGTDQNGNATYPVMTTAISLINTLANKNCN